MQTDLSKQALVITKKFQDAYKLHITPVLKNIAKEFQDHDHDSLYGAEDTVVKEIKLSKGLQELALSLSRLVVKINKDQSGNILREISDHTDLRSQISNF